MSNDVVHESPPNQDFQEVLRLFVAVTYLSHCRAFLEQKLIFMFFDFNLTKTAIINESSHE